ncbi:hypothetical protein DPMN_097721 [Dreissena polymorpha]|uniref:Uncharacterized protein n=1 Tax=Dreissena polymorpha TaxID=45954 RepID=A0A9D4LC84_DREPO|nr:hypothetical protein DPMN_097721 [Dreissena polymorpha]
MIICGRSSNPFLPSCCALGQERIFRAFADDHALENVYYPYNINSIKPDQAVGYWSGSVGMSGRGGRIATRSTRPLFDLMYTFTRLLHDGYSTVHDHFPIAIRPYTISVPDLLDLYPSYFRSLCTNVEQPSRSGRVKIWWRSS